MTLVISDYSLIIISSLRPKQSIDLIISKFFS